MKRNNRYHVKSYAQWPCFISLKSWSRNFWCKARRKSSFVLKNWWTVKRINVCWPFDIKIHFVEIIIQMSFNKTMRKIHHRNISVDFSPEDSHENIRHYFVWQMNNTCLLSMNCYSQAIILFHKYMFTKVCSMHRW